MANARDPYIKYLPKNLEHYLESVFKVAGDGNCGYRAIAKGISDSSTKPNAYDGEKGWCQVRKDLIKELDDHYDVYNEMHAGDASKIRTRLNLGDDLDGMVGTGKWYSKLDMGQLTANAYHRPICFIQKTTCSTYLPLWSGPQDPRSCTDPIYLCFVRGNHWDLLRIKSKDGVKPIPRVGRTRHAHKESEGWKELVAPGIKLFDSLPNL